jgi:hypothetical protein
MQLSHVSIATAGRLPMFADDAPRRAALHILAQRLPGQIVAFALVDDHLHLLLLGAAEALARTLRDLAFALAPLVKQPLLPAHIKPVADDTHLRTTLRYLLEQPVHHNTGELPALATGSCYAEIAGARAIPGLVLQLDAVLPREGTRPELEAVVGLPAGPLPQLSPVALRRLGANRMVLAAAFAAGASSMEGRSEPTFAARRAVAELARESGIALPEVAFALDLTPDAVRRMEAKPADATLLAATRTRLALEQAVAAASRSALFKQLHDGVAQRRTGLGPSRLAARP